MRMLCLFAGLFLMSNVAISAPQVQQAKLENGLNILLIEAHQVPMVAMKLIVPAGSRFDADGKAGTAALMSGMLMDHTKKHDYKAWAALLDDSSIRLGAGVDKDAFAMSLTVLKEVAGDGMMALSEALLQPGWDKKRFVLLKENTISALVKAQEDAGTFSALAENELLFPNHPYGHPGEGTVASIKSITPKDIETLYANQIKPDGATLAVSGDISMKEVLKLARTYLDAWQGVPKKAFADITAPIPSSETFHHHVMDKHQMLVEWVRLGPSRHEENYIPMMVLNHMLGGGGFGSRLMEEVREKRGLTYGVYSYFQPFESNGAYVIRLQTRADQVQEAELVIKGILQDMAAGKISQDMLDKSKTNLAGGFAQRMDSNRERVDLLAMMGLYQRPLNYLENWTKSVESVTLADVREGAERFLQADSWKRIWVGPEVEGSN